MNHLETCKKTWLGTLASFGIRRGLMPSEELEIARAIEKHGAEAVELALFGARFEPSTEKFNPANYVKIARVLKAKDGEERIDRFVNLGARARADEEIKKNREAFMRELRTKESTSPLEGHEEYSQDPEKAKAVLEMIRGKA